ncbi:MAG: SHOCT domain-containing protein [Thermoplasmata archaeon]
MDNIGKSFKAIIIGIFSIVAILLLFWLLSVLFYGGYEYNGYYGMGMMFGDGIFIMILGVIIFFLFIGIFIWIFFRDSFGSYNHNENLRILEERYARGEINRDEYLRIREDLKKY